jgi:cytochrome c-type biogenesis protein
MTASALTSAILLPIGLGLVGFVEPCSIGSTLILVKQLEGKSAAGKLAQVSVFAGTRALVLGLSGMAAVVVGAALLGFQRAAWIALGALYLGLGALYLTGKIGALMVSLGPSLARLVDLQGSVALGILFGLNIPACAGPLLFVLLAGAAAGGTADATLVSGFLELALFGLALSLPLIVAVLFAPARRVLDWLAGLSGRLPFWTGLLLTALGASSIWFGLFVRLKP